MVVISHAAEIASQATESRINPWGLGNIAVMAFFVLSGFIIAEAVELIYRDRPRDFLINRLLRIIPPYAAALLVSIVVHLWLASGGPIRFLDYDSMPGGIFSAWNLLGNSLYIFVLYGLGHIGLTPDYAFVRYVWAARVELHFYIVYAIVCWSRSSKRNYPEMRRYAFPLAFAVSGSLYILSLTTKASMFNYFSFAPYFMLGVFLRQWAARRGRWAAGGGMLCIVMMVTHYVGYVNISTGKLIIGPLLVLFGLITGALMLAKVELPHRWGRIDRWLGDLSYPIYLNHYAVTIAFLTLCSEPSDMLFWSCVAASVAFAWFIALLTEPFTNRVREKIRGFSLR